MSRIASYIIALLICLPVTTMASEHSDDNGIISVKSKFNAVETLNKLESIVKEKGFTIFTRVSHSAGGKRVNIPLRPTELLIFGNPKGGTVLMQCNQTVGLDLPLKYLAWEDESGQTWISYNTATYISSRHGLDGCGEKIVAKVNKILNAMLSEVKK